MSNLSACRAVALAATTLAPACGDPRDATTEPALTSTTGSSGQSDADDASSSDGPLLDVGGGDGLQGCAGDTRCTPIDILFVVDNSATMGEEQRSLARNFERLVQRLQTLQGSDGLGLNVDVNMMVTTTDVGHPMCTEFQRDGYTPAQGSPIYTGCNARSASFSSVDIFNPVELLEACTDVCPSDTVPGGDPYIHFDPMATNVPMNDVAAALSCLAPQGIDGCGYEAPLEAMLQALRPDACWNNPSADACAEDRDWSWVNHGFLRRGSTLAIVMITDEADCSVASPDGFSYFTDTNKTDYWAHNPALDGPAPSSAICWNAGVVCEGDDGAGGYATCRANQATTVLHPTSRYTSFFRHLKDTMDIDVVMLGVLGVPSVTEHMDTSPYAPTEGGVAALQYRPWRDGAYDGTAAGGDILPKEWDSGVTAANKQWQFGIGPGCTGRDEDGEFTGQATPPVRILDVCASLDAEAQTRCCVESVCDADFSAAIDCLTGIVEGVVVPVG